jgi:hypothetical protein
MLNNHKNQGGKSDSALMDKNRGEKCHGGIKGDPTLPLGIKMWKKSQENLSYEEFRTIIGEKISELERCTPAPVGCNVKVTVGKAVA